jgi:hypothetical protein
MYLFVDASEGLERVPAELMRRFGAPIEAMTLMLTPQRRLARSDPGQVISAIQETGYYLQLPPSIVSERLALAAGNDKLPR